MRRTVPLAVTRGENHAYAFTGTGRWGNGDRVADAVEKIMGIEEEINADVDRLISIRVEVEKAIKSVPDETLRTLLELRYIDGMTWEKSW